MSLCWMSLCWMSLCWMSLCWASLFWMSTCWMSYCWELLCRLSRLPFNANCRYSQRRYAGWIIFEVFVWRFKKLIFSLFVKKMSVRMVSIIAVMNRIWTMQTSLFFCRQSYKQSHSLLLELSLTLNHMRLLFFLTNGGIR